MKYNKGLKRLRECLSKNHPKIALVPDCFLNEDNICFNCLHDKFPINQTQTSKNSIEIPLFCIQPSQTHISSKYIN